MRKAILLTAAALLVSACTESPTEPTEAAPSLGVASSHHSRAFRARWVSQPGDPSAVECAEGQFPGRSLLEGNATHMGTITGDAWACLQPTGPLSFQSNTAGFTLTAAHGDEVSFEMDPEDPQLWEVEITEHGAVVTSAGGFLIAGGTGKFEGASGHVRLTARRVGDGDTHARVVGRISGS